MLLLQSREATILGLRRSLAVERERRAAADDARDRAEAARVAAADAAADAAASAAATQADLRVLAAEVATLRSALQAVQARRAYRAVDRLTVFLRRVQFVGWLADGAGRRRAQEEAHGD